MRPIPSPLPKVLQVWGRGAIGPVPFPQEVMLKGARCGASWRRGLPHSPLPPAHHLPVPSQPLQWHFQEAFL